MQDTNGMNQQQGRETEQPDKIAPPSAQLSFDAQVMDPRQLSFPVHWSGNSLASEVF